MRHAERLRYAVLAAQREGNRILAEGLRPLGLTPSQAEALRVLEDHGPLSLKAVGEHLICETGSPSRLLSTLTDAGLVARTAHPEDGRAVLLGLTPAGVELTAGVRALEAALYADIDRRLNVADQQAALAALQTLIDQRPGGLALARRSGDDRRPPTQRHASDS